MKINLIPKQTVPISPARLAACIALLCGQLMVASGAGAQTLSSPIAASGIKGNAPTLDMPAGQGPGVHGANSPFAPLASRDDVLPWSVLTSVKTKTPVKYSMEPVVVEGRFLVLNDDSYGVYYRMTDATPVR